MLNSPSSSSISCFREHACQPVVFGVPSHCSYDKGGRYHLVPKWSNMIHGQSGRSSTVFFYLVAWWIFRLEISSQSSLKFVLCALPTCMVPHSGVCRASSMAEPLVHLIRSMARVRSHTVSGLRETCTFVFVYHHVLHQHGPVAQNKRVVWVHSTLPWLRRNTDFH